MTSLTAVHVLQILTLPPLLRQMLALASTALPVPGLMRLEPLRTPLVFHVENTALPALRPPPAPHAPLAITVLVVNPPVCMLS
jgi:hypothetical protein